MKKQMKCSAMAFSILCGMMLAATGCSQDEAMPRTMDAHSTQVPLTVTSAEMQADVTVTRASFESTTEFIGVFLGNVIEDKFYVTNNNVRYNYGLPSWAPHVREEAIYIASDNAVVCAYCPYRADVTDVTKVSLAPRILGLNEIPLAYAAGQTVSSTKNSVSFSLVQACSWLVINFTRGNTKDDITLSEFSLSNSVLCGPSMLDITTGKVTDVSAGGKVTFTGDIALAKNTTVTRNLSMPPVASLPGGLKVSVKVKEYGNKVLSTTLTGLTALARGYKYAVTITVDGDGMGVSSVEVLPWTTTTVNNGGNPLTPLP